MEYLILIVTFLFAFLEDGNACSCFPTHIQEHFCRSDYVIVATIKTVENIYSDRFKQTNKIPEGPVNPFPIQRKFRARIHRVFKSNSTDTSPKDIIINTPGSDAACGVELDLKKKYIIGGYKVENDYWINLCGWVQEFNTLNRQQLKGIKFFYGKNCKCKIKAYGAGNKKTCKWEPQWNNDCYVRHGVCAEKSNGSCSWKKNRKFKYCLQGKNELLPWKQRKTIEIAPVFDDSDSHSPGYLLP